MGRERRWREAVGGQRGEGRGVEGGEGWGKQGKDGEEVEEKEEGRKEDEAEPCRAV